MEFSQDRSFLKTLRNKHLERGLKEVIGMLKLARINIPYSNNTGLTWIAKIIRKMPFVVIVLKDRLAKLK